MGGTVTDQYALSMSFKTGPAVKGPALLSGKFCLLARNGSGRWVKAVTLNSSGSPAFVLGAYTPGMAIGTYGVNPVTRTAWAVVDYNGEFAVGLAK